MLISSTHVFALGMFKLNQVQTHTYGHKVYVCK